MYEVGAVSGGTYWLVLIQSCSGNLLPLFDTDQAHCRHRSPGFAGLLSGSTYGSRAQSNHPATHSYQVACLDSVQVCAHPRHRTPRS